MGGFNVLQSERFERSPNVFANVHTNTIKKNENPTRHDFLKSCFVGFKGVEGEISPSVESEVRRKT